MTNMLCIAPDCNAEPNESGSLCAAHGCRRCGGVILADTEDWPAPLCDECYSGVQSRGPLGLDNVIAATDGEREFVWRRRP